MGEYFRFGMRWVTTLNMVDWTYILLGTVCFGILMMRGFGSRHNY